MKDDTVVLMQETEYDREVKIEFAICYATLLRTTITDGEDSNLKVHTLKYKFPHSAMSWSDLGLLWV